MKTYFSNKNYGLLALIYLIIFFSISICKINCIKSESEYVIELDSMNIESEVIKSKYGFILFYSIDCSHCQAIEPIYDEAARDFKKIMSNEEVKLTEKEKLLKTKLEGLNFYRINSKKNQDLMIKYKINSVPQIVWYNLEKDHYKIYDSENELPSYYYKFAMKNIEFNVPELNIDSLSTLSTEKKIRGKNVMLFVGDINVNEYSYKNFMNTAWNIGLKNLFHTNDDKVKSIFKIDSSSDKFDVVVFKTKDRSFSLERFEKMNLSLYDFVEFDNSILSSLGKYNSKFDLAKASPIKKVKNLLKLFRSDPINRFTHENEKIISTGIPTLTLVHDYDIDSTEYTETLRIFTRVALKYRREIFFMLSTKYTKMSKMLAESFKISKLNIPILCLTSISNEKQSQIDKYRKKLEKGNSRIFSEENITEFIEKWKSMQLPSYVASEDIPENPHDENNIVKLVGDNFKSTIEEKDKYILLALCAERLEVCVKFRQRLIRIANKLKNSNRIIIAELNPYENEMDSFEFRYIPSVFLIPDKGEKLKNINQYKGRLETVEIIKWVKEIAQLGDFEEVSLPIEDTLMKEEIMNELKPYDLEIKGTLNKLYQKLIDSEQMKLWDYPNREEARKEQEILDSHLINFFTNFTKEEL